MDFEWDENKNASNILKHGIDFKDALHVFLDDRAIIKEDSRKNYGERRMSILGLSSKGLLLVVYTERHENTMRLISARSSSRRERRLYGPFAEVSHGNR
jgi:uncharacterized DUF497 family protein